MKVLRDILLVLFLLTILHGCDSVSENNLQETPVVKNDIVGETPGEDGEECDWTEDPNCEPPEPDDGDGGSSGGGLPGPGGTTGGGGNLPPLPPPEIHIDPINIMPADESSSYGSASFYSHATSNNTAIPSSYTNPKLEVHNFIRVRKRISSFEYEIGLVPAISIKPFETQSDLLAPDFRDTAHLAYEHSRQAGFDCNSIAGAGNHRSFFFWHRVEAALVAYTDAGEVKKSDGIPADKLSNIKLCPTKLN